MLQDIVFIALKCSYTFSVSLCLNICYQLGLLYLMRGSSYQLFKYWPIGLISTSCIKRINFAEAVRNISLWHLMVIIV